MTQQKTTKNPNIDQIETTCKSIVNITSACILIFLLTSANNTAIGGSDGLTSLLDWITNIGLIILALAIVVGCAAVAFGGETADIMKKVIVVGICGAVMVAASEIVALFGTSGALI